MSKLVFVLLAVLFVSYVQSSAIDESSATTLKETGLTNRLEAAKAKIHEAKKKFDELVETLRIKGKKVAVKVRESAIKLGNEVKDAFNVILECAKQELIPLSEKVKEEVKSVIEGIKQIQKESIHTDKNRRNLVEQTKVQFENAKDNLDDARKKLDEFISKLVEVARVKIAEGAAATQGLVENLKSSVTSIGAQFRESLKSILHYANQKLNEMD